MKKVFKGKILNIGLSLILTFSLLLSASAPVQAVSSNNTNAGTNISQFVQSSSALNENDVIYMVLTDRFYDGDSANNGTLNVEYRPGNLKYTQGGDWKGLTEKLDYIKDLGVTAIWISPVSENEPLSRDKSESGYHGYFTHDYNKADPHFGSKQELVNLVSTAHSKGLKVILDAVPNHTADYLSPGATSYSSSSYQPAAPFNNPNWYHHYGDITDWNNPFQVLNYDLGGLDDLNQDNPDARAAIKNAYKTWVKDTGADGVRVDAARSIPKDFLAEFEKSLGVPTFGEVFVGDVDYVSDFQKYEWGVLDFPLFFQAREVFAHDANFTTVKKIFDQDSKYKDPNRLVTFIDNHDRDRFLCLADDNFQKMRLALTFMFTVRGIPDVYYGTEQDCYGGGKPTEWAGIANKENREVMPGFSENGNMYQFIQRLTQLRRNYSCLRTGTQREMWCESNIYSFSRRDDSTGQEIITVINNGTSNETRDIPLRAESSLTAGTKLTNLLDTSVTTNIVAGGTTGKQISVSLPAKTAYVFTTDSPAAYAPPAKTVTTIRVHYDAGLGNNMYLRGSSYPLWWDSGRKMFNVNSNTWTYELERIPSGQTFEFKPIINDSKWASGNNYVATGGQTVDIYPNF